MHVQKGILFGSSFAMLSVFFDLGVFGVTGDTIHILTVIGKVYTPWTTF